MKFHFTSETVPLHHHHHNNHNPFHNPFNLVVWKASHPVQLTLRQQEGTIVGCVPPAFVVLGDGVGYSGVYPTPWIHYPEYSIPPIPHPRILYPPDTLPPEGTWDQRYPTP